MIKNHFGSARASSLQPGRICPLLFTGLAAFLIGAAGHTCFTPSKKNEAIRPVAVMAATTAPVVEKIVAADPVHTAIQAVEKVNEEVREIADSVSQKPMMISREVELGKGGSFVGMLNEADISPAEALAVASALNKVYSHKKLKAGQEVTLVFSRHGNEEILTSVVFQPEPTKEISITRGENGQFVGQVNTTPLERKRFAVRAEIRRSLYETGEKEGIPRSVMAALLRAYAHTVDFQRDIHPGDRFEVLYDQPTAKDGTPVGQGVIIYAALEIGGKMKPLYRVTFADGTVDYFDEQGKSIKQALLRTPLDSARVTSSFGMRRHPLLGYSKMHQGIDFGAAYGTPIFAAGDGVVAEVGFKGGYGRFILLRHNNRAETAYAHMSRFARGIYPGARVNQGDVIGFVGSSGRSTGPHLHFEVRVNHRQVNPLSVNMPTGRILEGKLLTQFREGQKRIKKEFASVLSKESYLAGAQVETGGIVKASTSSQQTEREKPHTSCGLRGGC